MNPLDKFREISNRKLERNIRELAEPISVALIDSLGIGEAGPHTFDVGKKPRNLSGAEYTEQIQRTVMSHLGRVGLQDRVEYDAETTRDLSTENIRTPDLNWQCVVKDNIQIAFRQSDTITA